MSASLRRSWLALGMLLPLGLVGCSASPGGGVTLFPTGHRLTPDADRLRRMTPDVRPLPRELQKTVLARYLVEPGDGLLVEPVDFDSDVRLPPDQVVLADGTIDLGEYGRPVVAGLTVDEIESVVVEALGDAAQPGDVNVRLVDPESKLYYVLGEVNAPGAYPLIGRETVLDAIVAAGGPTDRAELCDIVLVRPTPPDGCRVVLPVCYRQIVQVGDTTTNYQIMPGDRVFVATRSFWDGLLPCKDHETCPLCRKCQYPCPDVGYAMLDCPPAIGRPPEAILPEPAEVPETAAPGSSTKVGDAETAPFALPSPRRTRGLLTPDRLRTE